MIIVLCRKHFQIYKEIKRWAEERFMAKDGYKFVKKYFGRTYAYKVIYLLFGKGILVASDSVLDKKLRNRRMQMASGGMISVPSKTFLKFNPNIVVMPVESGGEVKSVENLLLRRTSFNDPSSVDFVLGEINKEVSRLERLKYVMKKYRNIIEK